MTGDDSKPALGSGLDGNMTTSLNGKTIVFTGTLSMKRAEAAAQATALGAKVTFVARWILAILPAVTGGFCC